MTVNDVIQANEDLIVDVCGLNPRKDCNPYSEKYYSGSLQEIPSSLRNCSVLNLGYLFGSERPCIVIYPIKKD